MRTEEPGTRLSGRRVPKHLPSGDGDPTTRQWKIRRQLAWPRKVPAEGTIIMTYGSTN